MDDRDRDDPFARLDASHRRHDEELRALVAAAERIAGGAGRPGDLDTIAEAIAFFARSAPRHFADEEEALFPRLVARAPELAPQLARIAAEHREHEALHARLRERWEDWAGDLPAPDDAAALLAAARALEVAYAGHMAEEDDLFGRARDVLDAGDRAAVAAAMDARRGRGGGGGGGGGGGRRRS